MDANNSPAAGQLKPFATSTVDQKKKKETRRYLNRYPRDS